MDCPPRRRWAATCNNSISRIRPRLYSPAPPPLRYNQRVPSQSTRAPEVQSSPLNGMFRAVATVFQQIMTEFSETESIEIHRWRGVIGCFFYCFEYFATSGCDESVVCSLLRWTVARGYCRTLMDGLVLQWIWEEHEQLR
jgi:hypothetical protein